jgi:PAS domain S-box-containing protein
MEQNTSQFDEEERLSSLYRLRLLDTNPEQEFDELVKLAAELFEAPISLISLVDKDRLWVKAKYGIDITEISRDNAFCDFAISQRNLFVVENALIDSRFNDSRMVKGEANIQSYAGVPLLTENGFAVGVLSVLDHKARVFTEKQLSFLKIIGKQIEALLKLRLRNLELEEINQRIKKSEKQLKESEEKLNTYFNSSNDSIFIIDSAYKIQAFNKHAVDTIFAKHEQKIEIGESILDYLDYILLSDFKENFTKAFSGEEIRIESNLIINHVESWWAVTYLPLKDSESKIIAVTLSLKNIDRRKKAELELKKSETRLNLVLAGVNDGWWDWNLEDSYLYYSPKWWYMLGYQPEELPVTPYLWHQLLHPDDVARVDVSMEANLGGNVVTYEIEFRLLHKLGHYVPVLSKGHILRDDHGNAIRLSGSNMDLTAIKKVEQEQQAIIAGIPDLLFRFDNEDRYSYIHASKHDELLLPIENLLGKKIEDVVPYPAVQILKDTIRLARLSGNVEVVEYSLDIPKLGFTWFEARIIKSSETEVILIVRNITERKNAEKALQKSEANLNTVFENTDVGYYLFDENLDIVAFNEPAQRFTTIEFHKPLEIGNNFYDYFPEETKNRLAMVMSEVFKGKKTSYERQFEKVNEEDSWYHTMYSPVSNAENKVVGAVMSTENITKRKQNEIALNKSLELLSDQNKRLLNFSYIVSHNLRSHTSNIKSILNLLPYASSEEERNKMIELLEVASNLLNETIHNLNEVVSIQNNLNLVIEPINLQDSIKKTLLVLDEQIVQKKAKVKIEVDDKITINYNPAYLESILLNFLSNAIKYSHPDRLPIVSLTCNQFENHLLMIISDNGIGIDMKKHGDEIFGMYKTFNGNSDARGVGLFITKNQIEAMGGRVEVISELGKGTTFKIYIK